MSAYVRLYKYSCLQSNVISSICFRFYFFINVYVVLFLFDNVIYVFLLL